MDKSPPRSKHTQIPYPEYTLRVILACLEPPARLAVHAHSPLDLIRDMLTLAMWREAKNRYVTNNMISLIFGKSLRTVKYLSARFNKDDIFDETEISQMRRVEDLLRQRPMSLMELARNMPHSGEVDTAGLAVKALLRNKRIEALPAEKGQPTRYQVVDRHLNLFTEGDWEARLDALTEHLEAVTETVRRRFLSAHPETAAARTFAFKARPEDVEAFRTALFDFIREGYMDLESKAEGDPDARVYSVYAGATETADDADPEEGLS
ncbi:MAG: hypothetical protein ACE366_02440 [Bradymonadia bacterium]